MSGIRNWPHTRPDRCWNSALGVREELVERREGRGAFSVRLNPTLGIISFDEGGVQVYNELGDASRWFIARVNPFRDRLEREVSARGFQDRVSCLRS